MNFKTFAVFIIILLIAGIASAAYATFQHSAFKIGDGKDINLMGQAVGNGTTKDFYCSSNCTGYFNSTNVGTETNASNLTLGTVANARLTDNITGKQNITAKSIGGVIYADQYATFEDAVNASAGKTLWVDSTHTTANNYTYSLANNTIISCSRNAKINITGTTAFLISGKSNITIQNCYIEASLAGPVIGSTSTISIRNSQDIWIENNKIIGNKAFGTFVGADTGMTSQRIYIRNNYITGLGNNDVVGAGDPGSILDYHVEGNTVYQDASQGAAFSGGIANSRATQYFVVSNTVYGNIVLADEQSPHMYVIIEGNVVLPANGLSYGEIDVLMKAAPSNAFEEINIIGNTLKNGQITVRGISTSYGFRPLVSGNTISSTGATGTNYGIQFNYVSQGVISNNIISGSSGNEGVNLTNAEYTNVYGNTFANLNFWYNQSGGDHNSISNNMLHSSVVNKNINGLDSTSTATDNFNVAPYNFGNSATAPIAFGFGDSYSNTTSLEPNCKSTAAGTTNWQNATGNTTVC